MTDKPKLQRTERRSSPDVLVRTSKQGDIELKEEDLTRVSGGALYMKYGDVKGVTLEFTTTTKGKVESW
jgi:hypothetical protein